MRFNWTAIAVALLATVSLPPVVHAQTIPGLPPEMAAFGPEDSSLELFASTPGRDQHAYRSALDYLRSQVRPNGQVMNSPDNPATTAVAGTVLSALAMNQQPALAQSVATWLLAQQNPDGGFGAYHGSPSDLEDTARALLGLEQAAYLSDSSLWASARSSITRASTFLQRLATPAGGLHQSPGQPPIPALGNAVAARALIIAGSVGQVLRWPGAQSFLTAGQAAAHALNADNTISRTTTSDFIAAPLMGLNPSRSGGQRQVASLFSLSLAYPGYGAKAGPGYLSGSDWVEAGATFNLAIAAANVGLKATALSQYHAGLLLQNPNGGFGISAHPSVGAETGGYSRGPGPSRAGVSAQFLIATDVLVKDHILAEDGTRITWRTQSGRILTADQATASLDPMIPMASATAPRVAVVVASQLTPAQIDDLSAASPEIALEVNPAYELIRLGYSVQLFWVKPNQAGVFYPLSDLWPNLSAFQVLVLPSGSFSQTTGLQPAVDAARRQITEFVRHGGRLMELGETAGLPIAPALAVGPTLAKHAITAVSLNLGLTSANPRLRLSSASSFSQPAGRYLLPAAHLRVLGRAKIAHSWLPVVQGLALGQGRVLTTTLDVASPGQDQIDLLAAFMAWLDQGLQPPTPAVPSTTEAAHALVRLIHTLYHVPSSALFLEADRPSHRVSYLWPFTQVMAGVASLARSDHALLSWLDQLEGGLRAYFNPKLSPPAYVPYLASQGGTAPYYDDDGWVGLDLMNLYQMTGQRQALRQAEVVFQFLSSGWNHHALPLGGEYFDILHQVRTQTATGSFLTLALRLYEATGARSYLNWAERITTWDNTYMRGPNGIYWDSMTAQGHVKGIPLPSDTGIMLQADVLWYRIDPRPAELIQAENLADAALTVFVNPLNGQIEDDAVGSSAAFNTMLLEGFAMLYHFDPNPRYRQVIVDQAETAIRDDRQSSGVYGDNWNGLNNPRQPVGLLTEGATLNLLGLVQALGPSPSP